MRAFEAAAAGALLFQEAGNRELSGLLTDRHDCVHYRHDRLKESLEHGGRRGLTSIAPCAPDCEAPKTAITERPDSAVKCGGRGVPYIPNIGARPPQVVPCSTINSLRRREIHVLFNFVNWLLAIVVEHD